MRLVAALVASSILISSLLVARNVAASSPLTILSVAPDTSSAVIRFAAVDGAKDYRIYDVTNPSVVKYAGLAHLTVQKSGDHFVTDSAGTVTFPYTESSTATGPTIYDGPADSIQWNLLEDGKPHTLVVQAVNELGPVPQANLYNTTTNAPLYPGMNMLGQNEGPTSDGLTSINGQGPYSNHPQVIAQSQPFTVQASGVAAIPSTSGATSTFFDGFATTEGSTIVQTAVNPQNGSMTYTMNSGTPLASHLFYTGADTLDSMPMVMDGHFMDTLFDGGTPGYSSGMHQAWGTMSLVPDAAVDPTGGKLVHLTMEVDARFSERRWVSFGLAPANNPMTKLDPGVDPLNTGNQGLILNLGDDPAGSADSCTLDIYNGSTSTGLPTGTAGGADGARLWGAAGQAPIGCYSQFEGIPWAQYGTALDHRTRFDLFLTQSHVALFINGKLANESDIPSGGMPWFDQPLQAYYTHYVYHTALEQQDLLNSNCHPLQSYWFNEPTTGTAAGTGDCTQSYPAGYGFPHSDERHWDNIGFESLPATDVPSGSWSGLSSLIQLPPQQAPVYVSGTPVPTGTAPPTSTPVPTSTAVPPTNTPVPTGTTPPPTTTPGPCTTYTLNGHTYQVCEIS